MDKRVKTVAIVAVVAVVAYLAYRHFRHAGEAGGEPPTGLGTNLNSVAPELVGGSTGPSVGPAVTMPLQITLNETVSRPDEGGEPKMQGSGHKSHHPVHRQRHHATPGSSGLSVAGADVSPGVIGSESGVGGE